LRLKYDLTEDEMEEFEKGRSRIMLLKYVGNIIPTISTTWLTDSSLFSVWRPLTSVVEDAPLTLCDRRSVAVQDLAACDMLRPANLGEEYFLKYRPTHKWFWMSKQTTSEPVLFTTWNSHADADDLIGRSLGMAH
jgi:hypothetical protein